MIFLLACATHHAPAAEAPVATATAAAQSVAEEAQPPAPTWWRSGVLDVPDVGGTPSPAWSLTLGGPVTEPLVSDEENIWIVADGAVVCVDLAGGRKWTAKIGAKTAVERTPDGIVVGTDTAVLWLDPASGAVRKQEAVASPARHRPLGQPGGVVWTTQDGGIFDAVSRYTGIFTLAGRVAGDGIRVFAASTSGEVVAIEEGKARWSVRIGAPPAAGPSFDGERVFLPFNAQETAPGGVVALSTEGAEVWRWRSRFGPAAPVSIAEHVYVADRDGMVYALDRGDGSERWSVEGYGAFSTTPVLVGRSLYVGNGDGSLYRIDRDDGGVAWKTDLGAPISADPTVTGRLVVAGLANGRVVALGG